MVETVLAAPLQYGLLALAAVLVLFALTGPPRGSPPMASVGLPFIGNFIEFGKNPIAFILMGVEKFGNVFTVKMFGKRLTFLIGPEPAKQFFASKDDTMSQPEVYVSSSGHTPPPAFHSPTTPTPLPPSRRYGFMTAVFGKGVVYDATPKIRRQQMQHMTTGLISDALRSYVTKIEAETNAFLAKWPDDGEVDLIKDLGEMIILTASRCLHGDDVRETMFADVARLYVEEAPPLLLLLLLLRLDTRPRPATTTTAPHSPPSGTTTSTLASRPRPSSGPTRPRPTTAPATRPASRSAPSSPR